MASKETGAVRLRGALQLFQISRQFLSQMIKPDLQKSKSLRKMIVQISGNAPPLFLLR